MTTAELKDAAIFVMAYSFLKMDSTEKLGLFINKKASKFINELIEAMTPIVGHYHAFKRRIETQINALDNKASTARQNFSTTAPQLACDLLCLRRMTNVCININSDVISNNGCNSSNILLHPSVSEVCWQGGSLCLFLKCVIAFCNIN